MTRSIQSLTLTIGSMIFVAGFGVARADDAKTAPPAKAADEKEPAKAASASADEAKPMAPEKLLESKGLTKDEHRYLLDEEEALKKYEEAKSDYAAFQKAFGKAATIVQFDEMLAGMQMEQQEMQQTANMMQSQVNSASRRGGRMRGMMNNQTGPLRMQASQAKAMASQMTAQINAYKNQGPKPQERSAAQAEFDRTRLALVNKVGELNELVAPLLAKYKELKSEKPVLNALVDLRKSTGTTFKLGPSDELAAAAKLIQNVKKNSGSPASSSKRTKKKTATKK